MEPALYERIFRVQGSHWWHLSRMRFLDVLLRDLPRSGHVLDVGCGPGSMLHYLGSYGAVVGVDRHLPALAMARSHFDGPLVGGDCCRLPFVDGRFSLVFAGEVLYHRTISDVQAAVRECVRVLAPGGSLVVVDSAYAACMSAHDQAAHGARRFTRGELAALLRDAGLQVRHATYAYSLLLPVVWLVRTMKRLLHRAEEPGAELEALWGPLNRLLIGWFTLEAQVAGRFGLPFGLSVQVVGRKA
jgi:SAM-dependent methyltransferase